MYEVLWCEELENEDEKLDLWKLKKLIRNVGLS